MVKTPTDETPTDNEPGHISVYGKHTYHHTGIFQDTPTAAAVEHEAQPSRLLYPVAVVLLLILALYGYLLHQGLPQKWTKMSNEPAHHQAADGEHAGHADHADDHHAAEHAEDAKHQPLNRPPIFMVAPFAILLLCIAILPLVPATAHWWESNTSKFLTAAGLGIITLLYYYLGCNFSIHPHFPGQEEVIPAAGSGLEAAKTIFINAIVCEFLPFIVLLFSLFTITGGIRIGGNLKATPFVNSVILLIGAVLASFIGTTGAAMLLIRLLLETNKERKYKAHTVVMFIFCVCNCGGCLTPLGDPPLFLGYLRGVAFEWTFLALIVEWAFVNLILIAFYFLWDLSCFYWRESKESKQSDTANKTSLAISGWMLNVPLLLGVVAAVALLDPGKAVPVVGETLFPENNGHPWFYLREAVQLGLAAMSLLFGSYKIRKENVFNFLAISEVAALFFGIFICMQAPLQILHEEGRNLVASAEKSTGLGKEKLFFWSSGALSSVLDNAPTYVVFFETAKALTPNTEEEKAEWLKEEGREFKPVPLGKPIEDNFLGKNGEKGQVNFYLLVAVSLGAVFMGSMTYIGNGPNFMVKAIAEQDGVKMPSFFGYMLYSFLILLPLLIGMTLLFL
jgi:Na+/H+ antiporter NhaD/arsenite permease-like protein